MSLVLSLHDLHESAWNDKLFFVLDGKAVGLKDERVKNKKSRSNRSMSLLGDNLCTSPVICMIC